MNELSTFGSPFTLSESLPPAINMAGNPWEQIKERLRSLLDPPTFNTWIAPLSVRYASEKEIIVSVPNMVFYQGLMSNFLEKIELSKSLLGIDQVIVRYEIDDAIPADSASLKCSEIKQENACANFEQRNDEYARPDQNLSSKLESSTLDPQSRSNLNRSYTFATFVRGPSNQFAHASCAAVADNPGKTYNPLFIYGSTGLGKTHLLHAVGNHVLQTNPRAVVTYISSERFMNEMIYCLRFEKMWEFRQKYRFCDVLLVDDIQFISGRERTQEEFFHTFNALYEAKKQIVITSDRFPHDIPDIEERLRNRFQWGLIADIQPPDTEHRIAILMTKALQLGIKLSEEVALYIANHAKRNIRELEGALHRIAAFSALHGVPISLNLAIETFKNVLSEPPKRMTVELVQKVVADHYKIKVADLKSKKRHRLLTLPRQIAMYLARTLTEASFPEIGERFGGKDHTTVMHAVRKIDADRAKDIDLKAHIEALERQLEQII